MTAIFYCNHILRLRCVNISIFVLLCENVIEIYYIRRNCMNNTETTAITVGNIGATDIVDITELRTMSNTEIEHYGSNIQQSITDKSNELLRKATVNETGSTKESLDALKNIVDKRTRNMPTALAPLYKLRNFVTGYQKVEKRIDDINEALIEQQNKLNNYIGYMEEQSDNIGKAIVGLSEHENKLQAYVEELKNDKDNTDQSRLQVVANRLKIISGTRVTAEQAQVSSLMIIAANRESKHQLEEVTANVMPILKMQTVNAIGIKANKESIEIANKTRKITGELIEKNAKDVKEMTEQLQKNRTSSIIDEDKLIKAQEILKEAMECVVKASEKEAEANLRIVENIKNSAVNNQNFIEQLSKEKGVK